MPPLPPDDDFDHLADELLDELRSGALAPGAAVVWQRESVMVSTTTVIVEGEGPPEVPGASRPLPAGRVLQVMLVALVVGALFNIDHIVKRSSEQPLDSTRREWGLNFWCPMRSFSHTFGLAGLRERLDEAVGGDEHGDAFQDRLHFACNPPSGVTTGPLPTPPGSPTPPSGAPGPSSTPSTTPSGPTTTAAQPVELPAPTPDDPLRVWVGGDSIMQTFGLEVVKVLDGAKVTELVSQGESSDVDYRISTGLTRPDYFDWPAHLREVIPEADPDLVVIMFGANDAQGIQMSDGRVFDRLTPEWNAEYRRRVGEVMDLLRAEDRLVVWVGQPVMRDAEFSHRMDVLDRIYFEEAQKRSWVVYFDSWNYLADGSGAYAPQLSSVDGSNKDMRTSDGIHFSEAGGARLAWALYARLTELIDLRASKATPSPGSAPPAGLTERDEPPVPPEFGTPTG